MNISTVCKECFDRYPGCHDHCDKYKQAKEDFDNRKKIIFKAKQYDELYLTYMRSKRKKGRQI